MCFHLLNSHLKARSLNASNGNSHWFNRFLKVAVSKNGVPQVTMGFSLFQYTNGQTLDDWG